MIISFLVSVLALNKDVKLGYRIRDATALRTFYVTGLFGMSTETNFKKSLMVAKAGYSHVYPEKLRGLLAAMQASHQKKMYEMCGVHLQSQTAYEIASRGLIRPVKKDVPVIYGIKCVKFHRPEFVIEVQTINENEEYLCSLIHEIGIQMRTAAHCIGLRCERHGHFSAKQSLLRGNWHLQEVLNNLQQCSDIIRKHPDIIRINDPNIIMGEDS